MAPGAKTASFTPSESSCSLLGQKVASTQTQNQEFSQKLKSGVNTNTKPGTFIKITQIYPLGPTKLAKIYRLMPINRDHRSYKDRSITSYTGRMQPDGRPVAIKELEVEDGT